MKKLVLLSICVIVFNGCDLAKPQGKQESQGGSTPLAEAVTGIGVAGELQGQAPPGVLEAELKEEAPVKPETERVEAKAGVTGKGQYGQKGGEDPRDIITVPVGEYWRTKERTVFDIQIPHAMNLYKAMNDDKMPASHDEFMKNIIETNHIKLPDLPEGHKYIYNPETAKLEVERPR